MAWFRLAVTAGIQAPGPGRLPRQATSQEPSSRPSMRCAAPAALNEAGAQLEAVVPVDPSPSWGPGHKKRVSLPAVGPQSQTIITSTHPGGTRRTQKGQQALPPIFRTPHHPPSSPSPSFPTVKMVCQMLLGDAKVLKGLLVAGFEGALPGPAMKQLPGGIGAPFPQRQTTEGTDVTVLLLPQGPCTRGQCDS